jgi:2-keto-4-pentenoate hydratase/2-oxohepta-3-ene-1,7-dioic acid hydratase in catechol pathway
MAAGPQVVGVELKSGEDRYVDLHGTDATLPHSLIGILDDPTGLERARTALQRGTAEGRFVTGQVLAPIPKPGKILCIGLNYRDHAKESNSPIPAEPIVFSKFATAVIGPEAPILLPRVSQKVDFEAELVMVVGRRAKHVAAAEGRSYIAGYMNGNDVSARDWQLEKPGKQWLMGKSPDTFAPTGPYFVTADDVPNPADLPIRLRLNGQTMQDSSTRELIFTVERLIEQITKLITLEPGDLIFTGTPPGVGMARTPPVFLKDGDTVEVEIGKLGTLRNPVRAE